MLALRLCGSVSVYGFSHEISRDASTSSYRYVHDFQIHPPGIYCSPCCRQMRELYPKRLISSPRPQYRYHYFSNFVDSAELRAHPHHSFKLEGKLGMCLPSAWIAFASHTSEQPWGWLIYNLQTASRSAGDLLESFHRRRILDLCETSVCNGPHLSNRHFICGF